MENNFVKLTPPWNTLRNEFLYTFGNSPLITVKPLNILSSNPSNKTYNIEIVVKDDDIAFALRQIVKPIFNFGTINIRTLIKNSNDVVEIVVNKFYEINEICDLFCTSLKSNSLFKGIIVKGNMLFSVFDKSIIQFFNDDTSDLCQNYNEITSKVFKKLCLNTFKNKSDSPSYFIVNFNTYSEKCIIKNKFYCPK